MTELTGTEVKGSHEMIREAEALARLLRVASGGELSLAVVRNHATTPKERQGVSWGEAHEMIDSLARTPRDAQQAETATCRKCHLPVVHAGGAWVVEGTGTTADGLSYCPPNPDAARVGDHDPGRGNG